jgi:putative molybdopterin biosynthesis protein
MPRRYLSLISFNEALRIMKESFPPPGVSECVPLEQAVGRVVAEPVYANYSVPGADLAAMDGIAVNSRDTRRAGDRTPLVLDNFVPINTGQPIPAGYDAVIMIEDVWMTRGECRIRKSAFPGQFIHPAGEDIRKGELILPKGHLIRSSDVGGLATYGITGLKVHAASVGFIPTGDELIPAGAKPGPGQVVESNGIFARSFFTTMGASFHRYPIVRDDPERMMDLVCHAVEENDLVVLSAGSSAGSTDFAEYVISSCGTLLFHGVAMKPGTPVMLGSVEGIPVLAVPGYPTAAACTIRELGGRLLEWWGLAPFPSFPVQARISQNLSSDLGYDEFISVSVGRVGKMYCAVPHSRGTGVQMSVIRSNGYLHIPASFEGIESGTEVEVILTVPPQQLERTFLVIGNRDPCINILADYLNKRAVRLHCCPKDTASAIQSLKGQACHAVALTFPELHPAWNSPPDRMSDDHTLLKITIAEVVLGIVSREGLGPDDLLTAKIINRTPGTSGRIVLDEILTQSGISPLSIHGYNWQARNEDAVTAAVTSGLADAGICTQKAAEASGLLFHPLAYDTYYLIIRDADVDDPLTAEVISEVKSTNFSEILQEYGYYRTVHTGRIN